MANNWRLRQSIIPYFLISLGLIFILYLVMIAIEPLIANNRLIPGFNDVLENYESGSFSGRFGWFLRDISEAQFYGAWLPSIGLLGGGILAWFLEKRGKILFGMKILGEQVVFGMCF